MQIKITKKLLNKYRKYKQEIPLLKAELEEMRTTDAGLGNSTILNYQIWPPHAEGVVGFDWELYKHRQRVLEQREAQVAAVEKWIGKIQDGQTRCVFRMRYIEGLGWVKIAEKTGYGGNVDYPRLYIRDKYLKKYDIQ